MIPLGSGGEGVPVKLPIFANFANQGIVIISEKLCSGIREKVRGKNPREKRYKKD
jgi:hypothetical protein